MTAQSQQGATGQQPPLAPADLQDVLASCAVIQADGGRGSLEIVFRDTGIENIKVNVKAVPKEPTKPLSSVLEHWPRFVLVPEQRAAPS